MLVIAAAINSVLLEAATRALNESDNVVVVSADPSYSYDFNPAIRMAVHSAIWILYFFKSRRVKVTFTN
jgi:hypothetical protein